MIDPTARADAVATEVRQWYEANRESWWDRHAPFLAWRTYIPGTADNFMLKLIKVVRKADERAK